MRANEIANSVAVDVPTSNLAASPASSFVTAWLGFVEVAFRG